VTLAFGVGATTAVFSVVHGVMLEPLPYLDSARLVRLWEQHPGGQSPARQESRDDRARENPLSSHRKMADSNAIPPAGKPTSTGLWLDQQILDDRRPHVRAPSVHMLSGS
jgi:hypothetical protein